MGDLKVKQEKIENERKNIIQELKKLRESKIIKRYFELSSRNEELLSQQNNLIREIKMNEYKKCNHIFIMTKYNYDYSFEGRSEKFYGCVKCGLNEEVLTKTKHGIEFLTLEEQVMYDYIRTYHMDGIYIDKLYDLEEGRSIYNNIKSACPNIDDETACKYLEIALEAYEKENKNKEKKLVL